MVQKVLPAPCLGYFPAFPSTPTQGSSLRGSHIVVRPLQAVLALTTLL